MQFDVVVAFFVLGLAARLLNVRIDFPHGLYQSLILFLLLAIGLKGGIALHSHASISLLYQSLAIIGFGLVLPFVAFPILYKIGGLSRVDAASISAHYGSVSVATFAVAIAFLEARDIPYEPYFPAFVALLEVPAIAVGLWIAKGKGGGFNIRKVCREVFLNQGIVLLVGGLAIGWWAGPNADNIMPFFQTLFHGVLALFLLEMGRVAASRLGSLKLVGSFIATFGVVMALIGAVLGGLLAAALGFSPGGTILLATLGASASYIAVPAAMEAALKDANHTLAITAALAITFPFNVLVGISLYSALIMRWMG